MKQIFAFLLFTAIVFSAVALAQSGITTTPSTALSCSDGVNCTLPGSLSVGNTVLCPALVKVSGTSLLLTSAHNGCIITFSSATAVTVTVPTGLREGFRVTLVQLGTGNVTPTQNSTAIYQRSGYTKTAGQYAVASLISHVADAFVLSGDLQ